MGLLERLSVIDRFHLDPEYFPKETSAIFPIADILLHGALPLGVRTRRRLFSTSRVLNVGLLDPRNATVRASIRRAVLERDRNLADVDFYAIEAAELVRILERVYGLDPLKLVLTHPDTLCAPLREHLLVSNVKKSSQSAP